MDEKEFTEHIPGGFKTGDTVILKLNSKTKEIAFIKNARDYGVMSKIFHIGLQYRVGIYLHKAGDQIELMQVRTCSAE